MKVRRYFARDMRSALAMVRAQQGADVVILSNRAVDGGVEIVTADEPAPASDGGAAGDRHRDAAAGKPLPPTAEVLWTREPVADALREELAALRRLVEVQMAGLAWGELGRRHPRRAQMLRRLVALGLAPEVARWLVAEVPETLGERDAWHRTLAVLARHLPVAADPVIGAGGAFALVGPAGVGKTSFVAKLAARHLLEYGADSVALVSADARRVGARDELRSFGRILGVPVWSAGDAEELGRALDAAGDRRLVLVDTAGTGAREPALADLAAMLSAVPGLNVLMVMAAVTQARALEAMLEPYARLRPRGCLISRLDETDALGAALGAAIRGALPVAYVSAGCRIPEDLETVTAAGLVARAVKLAGDLSAAAEDLLVETAFAGETPHVRH